jgi:hypothetical protein
MPLCDVVRVTAADPGITHTVVTATVNNGVRGDGQDGGDNCSYKLHNKQYRFACGFTRRDRWRKGRAKGFKPVEKELADTGGEHWPA